VIKVSNITFTEGEGTLENPYRERSKTTNTSNIKVGEYLSIPTSGIDCGEDQRCLFRVVSKDTNSIKVILNGVLPNKSQFGSSVTYTSGNIVDIILTNFTNTIDNKYQYEESKVFNIGMYPGGVNYREVQTNTYTGNVGLPVVGEMFSGNDINISLSADITFVNGHIIENPDVADFFWAMNSWSNQLMNINILSGNLGDGGVLTYIGGIRPVLFLNHNLNFISGEGIAEHPFVLE